MAQRIVIDPVTRLEGHAKITIHLDDAGNVTEGRFHVTEFRGFERFCVGRPLAEMAGITSRICGICPVSHLLASAKTADNILAVSIPPTAEKLRRIMNLAQIIQSHALSFFHLSAPDLLLGMESDPAQRNVFGLIAAEPELARGGIRLRQFGQEIIEILGGRKIHPAWAIPGGVRSPLTAEGRDHIRARIPEAQAIILDAIKRFKGLLEQYREETRTFGDFPTLFMGLVTPYGAWEHYDGYIRFVDGVGNIVADRLDPERYYEYIDETVEPWSYLKFPYYRALGYPDGMYRVGPLARLNVCAYIGTPLADRELEEFRAWGGRTQAPAQGHQVVNSSFAYHYARLIEILTAVERIEQILDDPELLNDHLQAKAGINRTEAVGFSEAPRGTLFHHYKVNDDGIVQWVNLLIATGQNNLAMNRTVTQIAQNYIHSPQIPEGVLNRIEAGVRAFDPCLSCSTHAVGMMPLQVLLIGADGTVLDEVTR